MAARDEQSTNIGAERRTQRRMNTQVKYLNTICLPIYPAIGHSASNLPDTKHSVRPHSPSLCLSPVPLYLVPRRLGEIQLQ
ncbi:hypothetical protein FKW77_004782 [Venturia effusa]|uniref:Uncharacterized protein n=1 Tax=Venturia effusa TaxID=50376 RepID=A0A517LFD9_9PEZI|nr:hypothetical protein FKW77_004782 [Venturia effusa]